MTGALLRKLSALGWEGTNPTLPGQAAFIVAQQVHSKRSFSRGVA
jgi:hypothetical protein